MEVEITDGILFAIILGCLGWASSLQGKVSDLDRKIAINTTREENINNHIQNMEAMIKEISTTVISIEKKLAFNDGKNEKNNQRID